MAELLYLLGSILGIQAYIGMSEQMLSNMKQQTLKYLFYHGKWTCIMLKQIELLYELVISGKDAKNF